LEETFEEDVSVGRPEEIICGSLWMWHDTNDVAGSICHRRSLSLRSVGVVEIAKDNTTGFGWVDPIAFVGVEGNSQMLTDFCRTS
jgi:hypothetical protein